MNTIHSQQYLDVLRKPIEETPDEVMAVCQAWYGLNFGIPGYGSVAVVQSEITKVKSAIEAYKNFLLLTATPY